MSWEQFKRDDVRAWDNPGRCPECDKPLDDHAAGFFCCGSWTPIDAEGNGGGDGCAFCEWANKVVALRERFTP